MYFRWGPTKAGARSAVGPQQLHYVAEHLCVIRVVGHHVTVAAVSIFGFFFGAEAP